MNPTKVVMFDTHRFEKQTFTQMLAPGAYPFAFTFLEARLGPETAGLAAGFDVVCPFVNDKVNSETIAILKRGGVKLLALRSAGFNHVDLPAAKAAGIAVVRVPAYSPHAVAEHAVALLLSLVRKTHRSYQRVRELNFSLDGLVGFDLFGKTVGVVGTGKIGSIFAKIMLGFGCKVLAHDLSPHSELVAAGVEYVPFQALLAQSKVVSLHVPLVPQTKHLMDQKALALMPRGAILINTGRGALIDSKALISALKSGALGGAGLDVYEEEEKVFFQDLSDTGLQDDLLARLLTFPNVLITSHQGFLTSEALDAIAKTTLENIRVFQLGQSPLPNLVPG
jgi:D-lactate dehydrogenase